MARRQNLDAALQSSTARQVLARRALSAVYQPIVQLKDGKLMGHESLIRGPAGSPLQSPDALFRAARAENITLELERACLIEGLKSWTAHGSGTRLFLNL